MNFLDVNIRISDNSIKTSLYSKPTDAHLYLDSKSNHPHHVIKNIPKGQFIRVRRICTDLGDYDLHAGMMKKHFTSRGYDEKQLDRRIKEVREMNRGDLLGEKEETRNRDPNNVLVCTYHPKLRKIPSIFEQNHKMLSSDTKLSKIFKERSIVAFRRPKNIANYICKNDIRRKPTQKEEKCKGCIICPLMSSNKSIVNKKTGLKFDVKPGATCKTEGVIYALYCKKCDEIYIGHTGESISKRFSKHKYDTANRPQQNEFTQHCEKNHDLSKDIEIYILDHGIPSLPARERMEDRFICKLQTLEPTVMNKRIGSYAKEMYKLWTNALHI